MKSKPLELPVRDSHGVVMVVSMRNPPAYLGSLLGPLVEAAAAADREWVEKALSDYDRTGSASLQELTREQAIALLALALKGRKFKPAGRGKGRMRTLVEREIARLDGLSARQAWDRLGDMSVRKRMSIEFYDDHAYLPGEPTVSFRRFENLLSEIRRARR